MTPDNDDESCRDKGGGDGDEEVEMGIGKIEK